jgi:hypothetical protein
MVCYIITTTAAIIEYIRNRKIKENKSHKNWLNLMFLGGALFGIIDHLWNGELFLISANWASDLTLGFTITAGIIGSWGLIISMPKITNSIRNINNRLGILKFK